MDIKIRRILVAIRDMKHAPENELHKAGALARAAAASIELFHAIDAPDPGRSYPETRTRQAIRTQRTTAVTNSERRLEQFARAPALRGLSVTCTASWDFPPHEAIIRRALTSHSDLVIAGAHGHPRGMRWLLRNTDWELIRHCPLPLLLVKSRQPYRRPVVLAAVDPFHAHVHPAQLDARLLRTARGLAQLLHGQLHVFHAYLPLVNVEPAPVGAAPLVVLPPEAQEAHRALITSAIARLARSAAIPAARQHVYAGEVVQSLQVLTRKIHTDLVVMGAVSRSALARLFIGNTAERVLDRLGCDVLVVKPRGFKSQVVRRPPIALASARAPA